MSIPSNWTEWDRQQDEKKRILASARGRRYLVCQAMSHLKEAINAIPDGPYMQPRDGVFCEEGPFPGSSDAMRLELNNLSAVLLRMILQQNDGHVSRDKLNAF